MQDIVAFKALAGGSADALWGRSRFTKNESKFI